MQYKVEGGIKPSLSNSTNFSAKTVTEKHSDRKTKSLSAELKAKKIENYIGTINGEIQKAAAPKLVRSSTSTLQITKTKSPAALSSSATRREVKNPAIPTRESSSLNRRSLASSLPRQKLEKRHTIHIKSKRRGVSELKESHTIKNSVDTNHKSETHKNPLVPRNTETKEKVTNTRKKESNDLAGVTKIKEKQRAKLFLDTQPQITVTSKKSNKTAFTEKLSTIEFNKAEEKKKLQAQDESYYTTRHLVHYNQPTPDTDDFATEACSGVFAKVGKKPGTEIWKMEKMVPVNISKTKFGRFYSGDSYICLLSYYKSRSRNLNHTIFYWVGRKAPLDSSMSAAFLSIQLNKILGGTAAISRVVQGKESGQFLEMFSNGIKYLKGGGETILRHVHISEDYETRLIHVVVKGNTVYLKLVEPSYQSLNENDTFILDNKKKIYVWVGMKSTIAKKGKALEYANILNAENKSKGKIKLLERDDRAKSKTFWTIVGMGNIKESIFDKPNNEPEEDFKDAIFLYKISMDNGEIIDEVMDDWPLLQTMLNSNYVYILDADTEVYIWEGKKSSWDSKEAAIEKADEIMDLAERPAWTTITRITEGVEPVLFKMKFFGWVTLLKAPDPEHCSPISEKWSIDYSNFYKPIPEIQDISVSTPNEDPGSGLLEIWRMENENFAIGLLDEEIGEFITTKSYICLYTYTENGIYKATIYFLEGKNANPKDFVAYESGFYDSLLKRLEEDTGVVLAKLPEKERVQQGKESIFFRSLFPNGITLALPSFEERERYSTTPRMYEVRGSSKLFPVVEVEVSATRLNSSSCFVLNDSRNVFLWQGTGANNLCKDAVERFVLNKFQTCDIKVMQEGEEVDEFWYLIGGKQDYANGELFQKGMPSGYPRLFECIVTNENFEIKDIPNFSQGDLTETSVMALDAFYKIILWQGRLVSQCMIEKTNTIAEGVCKVLPERSGGSVEMCKSGEEPLEFRAFFPNWQDNKTNVANLIDLRRSERIKYIENQQKTPHSALAAELMATVSEKLAAELQKLEEGNFMDLESKSANNNI